MAAALGLAVAGISGCCWQRCEEPEISFEYVPPFGSTRNLRGHTCGVPPSDHRVVVYIRVAGTYWVKPTEAEPLTAVASDCTWEIDITTGGFDTEADEVRAYMVRPDYAPDLHELPTGEALLAETVTTRRPSIRLTDVGFIGQAAQLKGQVAEILPEAYRVLGYIQVDGCWWVKPDAQEPLTPIRRDGSWSIDIDREPTDRLATRVWAGIVRPTASVLMNQLPASDDVIASACAARGAGEADQVVSCPVEAMFQFVEEQLAAAGHDPVSGGLPAAYRTEGTVGLPDDFIRWAEYNAQVYDASVAATAMARITPQRRAALIRQIADALVFAIANDPAGDNRIRDAYWSNDIRAPEPDRDSPSIRDGQTHTGNAAWAIIALTSAHAATQDAKYLDAAVDLGNWVVLHLRAEDELGGYCGGLLCPDSTSGCTDQQLQRVEWRSVEHNTDLYTAFRSLANLTGDADWTTQADHARKFLENPALHDCVSGPWCLGTSEGTTPNCQPYAEDTATWPWLAGIRPCGARPLEWAFETLLTVSNGFEGIRFSDAGTGVVGEPTAHLALAMRLSGETQSADRLVADLQAMRAGAPNADGRAIVATPVPGDGVGSGLGHPYYAAPHVAATGWAILAETGTNPFEPVVAP